MNAESIASIACGALASALFLLMITLASGVNWRSLWLRLEKDDKKFLLWTWRFVNVYLMVLIGLR